MEASFVQRHCGIHGGYLGDRCPACSTLAPNPAPPLVLADPAEVSLQRIAVALERIADAYTGLATDD